MNELELLKNKIRYRASYRGTKEMDILLSSFVNKYINELDETSLFELEDFLNFEDEICLLYTSPSPRDGLLSRMPSSA